MFVAVGWLVAKGFRQSTVIGELLAMFMKPTDSLWSSGRVQAVSLKGMQMDKLPY